MSSSIASSSSASSSSSKNLPPSILSAIAGPRVVIFDDADTIYDGDSNTDINVPSLFPDVKPIFQELCAKSVRIVVLQRSSVVKHALQKGLKSEVFAKIRFFPVTTETLRALLPRIFITSEFSNRTKQNAVPPVPVPFSIMFVSADMNLLREVQKRSGSGILTVQARQVTPMRNEAFFILPDHSLAGQSIPRPT